MKGAVVRNERWMLQQIEQPPCAAGPRIEIDEALEKGWFEIWYQPKIDLAATFGDYAEELRAKIKAAELRVRQLTEASCPGCGYPIEKNFLRCPDCQRRLKNPCPNCGKPLRIERFCRKC